MVVSKVRKLVGALIQSRWQTRRGGPPATGDIDLNPQPGQVFAQQGTTQVQQQPGSMAVRPQAGSVASALPSVSVNFVGGGGPQVFTPLAQSLFVQGIDPNLHGWTVLTQSVDTRVIYVDLNAGNDSNNGLSQGAPVLTIAQALSLTRLGFPDWILIKRGGTSTTAFGQIMCFGRSAQERFLIGTYGTGARPRFDVGTNTCIFLTNNGTSGDFTAATWNSTTLTLTSTAPANAFAAFPTNFLAGYRLTLTGGTGVVTGDYLVVANTANTITLSTGIGAANGTANVAGTIRVYCDHLAITFLHLRAYDGSGNMANDGTPDQNGIYALGHFDNLLVEGCKIEAFTGNLICSVTPDPPDMVNPDYHWAHNVSLRRNIVVDAHRAGNDFSGQGVYAFGIQNLVIDENVLDCNGWLRNLRYSRPNFNRHNLYAHNATRNVTFRGNVSTITDCQMRAGGLCENNLFLKAYICLQWGLGSATEDDPAGMSGTVQGNVALDSGDIGVSVTGSALSWNSATNTLTFPGSPFSEYFPGALNGITFHVTAGTGATVADYTVTNNTSNTLTLATSIGSPNGTADIAGYTRFGAGQGPRGLFIYGGNIASTSILNNIAANNTRAHSAKFIDFEVATTGLGCMAATIQGNICYNWASRLDGEPGTFGGGTFLFLPGATTGYANINLIANDVQNNLTSEELVYSNVSTNLNQVTGSNNRWWSVGTPQSQWFFTGSAHHDLATFMLDLNPDDTTSTATHVGTGSGAGNYLDPTRDMGSYMLAVGLGSSETDYLTALRAMDHDTWDPRLMPTDGPGITHYGPLDYLRAGFSR